jgi:transcriptional accessory protein Tex/SPT6
VPGIVTKTKKYGAFLQIADGVEGLLHISELSWDHVERTEDVLKVGEEVEVMVLSADKIRRRISLSLRQLHGGGPTGEGDEITPPSYDYPEDEDDDETVVTGVTPMAAALTDAGVEGSTRAAVNDAVAAGTATAEEIAEDNAEADDAAAADRFDDGVGESELEAEVEEAAESAESATDTPVASTGVTAAAVATADADPSEPEA